MLLVMLRHAYPTVFGGAGIVGVTVFFTLSGYLITALLQRDLQQFGTIRWGRFYAHRALRLYPALMLLLLVFAVAEGLSGLLGERTSVLRTLLLGLTYTSDLPLPWHMSAGYTHLWTLAVEEQFYLVWPVALFLAARAGAATSRAAWVAAGLLTASCLVTLLLADSPEDIYERPTTWASAMALGAVATLTRRQLMKTGSRSSAIAAGIATIALAAGSVVPDAKDLAVTYVIGPAAVSLATIALILFVQRWGRVPLRAMRPLMWLGLISYGVYLWNLPVVTWFHAAVPHAPKVLTALTIPVTIGAAIVSWYTVERIGRLLRQRFDALAPTSLRSESTSVGDQHR